MTSWTPKYWATIPLPEWNPESLPGYAEAKAKAERGEPLFDKQPVKTRTPRIKRSLESLTDERDRLVQKRDQITGNKLPDDPGALSGIRKPNAYKDRKSAAKTERDLMLHVKLSQRIAYLDGRIRGAQWQS